MPQAVAKEWAEARLLNNGPSPGIHLLRWHAWTDGRKRLSLRLQHNSVHGFKFRRYPTARQNARQVAIVEPAARSPIDQKQLRLPDRTRRGRRMRQRRSLAYPDDAQETPAPPSPSPNVPFHPRDQLLLSLLH